MNTNEKAELVEEIVSLKNQVDDEAIAMARAIEDLMDSKIELAAAEKKLHDYEMEQLGKRLGL